MTMESLNLKGLRIGLQGREAFPDEDQCPECKFYFLTAEVLRVAKERTKPTMRRQDIECRCAQSERRKERERQVMMQAALLPHPSDPRTFENFEFRPGAEEALAASKLFVSGSMPEQVLTLCGTKGSGKSHLIEAALRHALEQRMSVRYAYVPDMLSSLRGGFEEGADLSTIQLLDALNEVDILALDDIGAQKSSEWVQEQITMLVDNRLRNERRLIVGTNQDEVEMEASIGGRVMSRLFGERTGEVKVIAMTCGDYRAR